MTFKNFEQAINETILDRGLNYFQDGAVHALEKNEAGWEAEVTGNERYSVYIEGKRKVKDWDCDCPYEEGPICKHVVATLYAIQDYSNKKRPSKAKANPINQLFDQVPDEELLAFFKKNINKHKALKSQLLIQFSNQLKGDKKAQFQSMIKEVIRNSSGRGGFIDYRSLNRMVQQLERLLAQSESLMASKNYVEAFQLNEIMLNNTAPLVFEVDDSSGGLQALIGLAIENISNLLEVIEAIELRTSILQFLITLYKKDHLNSLDSGSHVLHLLTEHYQSLIDFTILETLLLTKIEEKEQSQYGDYGLPYLISPLLSLYEKENQTTSYQALIQRFLYLPEVREELVYNHLDQKEWEKAKVLIEEGIAIAKQKKHPGTVTNWNKVLVEIAQLENDKPTLRTLQEKLYLDNHNHQSELYSNLKASFSKKEWLIYQQQLIKKIKKTKKNQWGNESNWLAAIYHQEKELTLLLAVVQKSQSPRLVLRYYEILGSNFPTETLDLMEPVAVAKAKELGRSSYRDLADFVKELKNIKGGAPRVDKLVKQFRQQYANRPALLDELSIF